MNMQFLLSHLPLSTDMYMHTIPLHKQVLADLNLKVSMLITILIAQLPIKDAVSCSKLQLVSVHDTLDIHSMHACVEPTYK